MSTLSEKLEALGLNSGNIARMTGGEQSTLWRFIAGVAPAGKARIETAYRIWRASRGKVTFDEIVGPELKADVDERMAAFEAAEKLKG